jgi:hypothetical protein
MPLPFTLNVAGSPGRLEAISDGFCSADVRIGRRLWEFLI